LDAARWQTLAAAHLRDKGRGPRSRRPVGARRSRRLLSLRDTARAMSRNDARIEMPRAVRVLAGAVLGIGALPFLYLGFAFPIAPVVSVGYQDDPYYMALSYGAACLLIGAFLAWSAWRLMRPGSRL